MGKGDCCTAVHLKILVWAVGRWGSEGNKCKTSYSSFLKLLNIMCI